MPNAMKLSELFLQFALSGYERPLSAACFTDDYLLTN